MEVAYRQKVLYGQNNEEIYAFESVDMNDEALKMLISMKTKGCELEVDTYMSMIISYGKPCLIEGNKWI